MIKTKGFAALSAKALLTPFDFNRRELQQQDVLIDIKYCGVCHSDLHMVRNEWGFGGFPMVPGHEIAGVISKVGSQVKKHQVGDPVGVGCIVDSCRDCSSCHEGLEQYCENGMTGTYGSTDKYGQETQGGYSKQIVVDENYVLKIPKNLSLQHAAPLLCAGITTFSPLKHWKAGPGKKIGVMGLGGLGHMGVKLANAMGAEVTVLSHSDKKREDSLRMGAKNFVNTSDKSQFRKLEGQFDLILNTVSAPIDLNSYLGLVKQDGAMVLLGLPEEAPKINAFKLIDGRKSLAGSLIGGIKETQEMLDFCDKHQLAPEIEIISMSQINEAYERMLKGDVRYRFVIDLQTLR